MRNSMLLLPPRACANMCSGLRTRSDAGDLRVRLSQTFLRPALPAGDTLFEGARIDALRLALGDGLVRRGHGVLRFSRVPQDVRLGREISKRRLDLDGLVNVLQRIVPVLVGCAGVRRLPRRVFV